ncbi:hypothetical protein AWL63_11095 [Sphingomonas panacis]|uniref:Uncharacterized protein n=1 Tax=Sphingomonas panacis TaxID=1560345 RepID=A0A1B3ZAH9_9SPHN|nr:hypothetical protein [Sphingomonas panacis]AOH84433.1 hypothetical protein AWL63_11095 [Sphingomonas panacis]
MSILAALIMFGLAAYAGSVVLDGWRAGAMPVVFLGGINPIVFSRISSPSAFWLTAGIEFVIALGFAMSGVLLLFPGVSHL